MSATSRFAIGLLVLVDAAALVFLLAGEPQALDFAYAMFLTILFTPVKGVTYRRLGGRIPFWSALVGTASWQLVGLPIDLDGFRTLMTASFAVSIVVDSIALVGMRTMTTSTGSFALALLGSTIVHLFTLGFFTFQRQPSYGVPILLVGTVLFLLPAFFADRFAP